MMFRGRIELIVGPMFAGKTTELMRRVKRNIHARHSCFVIKYANDTRYDKLNVASHDQRTLRADAAVTQLSEVRDQWQQFDVLAIDEGQFFSDLVTFCNTAADAGKMVMVSALDGDYRRKPFGQVGELLPFCESVDKLTAVCMMCHEQSASFTRRLVDVEQQELIGGADAYIATCRRCYLRKELPSLHEMRTQQSAIREVEQVCLGVVGPSLAKDPQTPEKSAGLTQQEAPQSPTPAAVSTMGEGTPSSERGASKAKTWKREMPATAPLEPPLSQRKMQRTELS